jgi:transaldolase
MSIFVPRTANAHRLFNENTMAIQKTAEGIRHFNADALKLEPFIGAKL